MKERLLQVEPDDPRMVVPLRNLRNEAALFREANIPLPTPLQKLADKYGINQIYTCAPALRTEVARNAVLPGYRAYAFRERGRFDYSPEDCFTFHEAIAEVVVPAARRVLLRRRERLGLDNLRPWDPRVEPGTAAPSSIGCTRTWPKRASPPIWTGPGMSCGRSSCR